MLQAAKLPRKLHIWFYSLKSRMIAVLLLSTIIPLVLIGSISYYSISAILDNKMQISIRNNLKQVTFSLENTLSNLNHVSQQLAFDGRVGKNLTKYLESNDVLEKMQLKEDTQNNLHLINFANPNLGLMVYYFADSKETLFRDPIVKQDFDPEKQPVLMKVNDTTYFGPHRTANRFIDSQVLSLTTKVEIPGYETLFVYIETSFELAQNILAAEQTEDGMNVIHLLIDRDNRIAYSENDRQISTGSTYGVLGMQTGGYRYFEQLHNQGWKTAAVIPESEYNREKNNWIRQFGMFTIFSLGAAVLLASIIWRTVYRRLIGLNKEIDTMQNSRFHEPVRFTKIIEFDLLLEKFQRMRRRIGELLREVEQKEQRKTELEIEKLLFQINPHFIHNTLDTIRWLARAKGLAEIDRLISLLIKVLYYNMGKGGVSTIHKELEALRDYIALQKIRYDFEFDIRIQANAEAMDIVIPRFILQPLVENSLYHGLRDEGVIEVDIAVEDGRFTIIQVRDNGNGMSEGEIAALLSGDSEERRQVGMGIGLYYVHRMIKAQFGEAASLHIQSEPGKGTSMILRLPLLTEGARADVEGNGG